MAEAICLCLEKATSFSCLVYSVANNSYANQCLTCCYFSFSTVVLILVLASGSLASGLEQNAKELDAACIEVGATLSNQCGFDTSIYWRSVGMVLLGVRWEFEALLNFYVVSVGTKIFEDFYALSALS